MNEQRNLLIAIALSVLILFGYQWLFPTKPPVQPIAPAGQDSSVPPVPALKDASAPLIPAKIASPAENRGSAVQSSRRIQIHSDKLHGSIALTGARLDDLTLADYRETTDANSPEITLLSPSGAPEPYYAEFGWVPVDAAVKVPDFGTQWTAVQPDAVLSAGGSAVLQWDNGDGLRFVRTYRLDEQYMFSVEQRVENYGTKPVTLHPYALISRSGTPKTLGMYILHEGPLGVLNGTLQEHKYADLAKEGSFREESTGGWIGITDKYWLTALIPDQKDKVNARFLHQRSETGERYQVDFTGQPVTIAAGASQDVNYHVFAGAKIVSLLDAYSEKLGVERFAYAIDFGWFWYLTKPFFYLLRMLHHTVGNMGGAILLMTVLIKLAMFPLANKSYHSMSKMKKLQPQMQALQARFAEDKPRLQQEMMAMYKREKVNPVSGCLPMLIQIPVFFALYKVLFVTIEMRHAPFIGWIHDLSAPDPTTVFNLFGVIPWDPPGFLHIGIWPLIMGVSMWLQQKLNPQPTDPVQAKMFMFLPIIFTFMLGNFAAGLVIYWAWSNSLSILQQWVMMRKVESES